MPGFGQFGKRNASKGKGRGKGGQAQWDPYTYPEAPQSKKQRNNAQAQPGVDDQINRFRAAFKR